MPGAAVPGTQALTGATGAMTTARILMRGCGRKPARRWRAPSGCTASSSAWAPPGHARSGPPVDIFENGRELWIIAALPGVEASRLEVVVENGVLVISGERPAPALQRASAIHRLELPQGRFERRIALPAARFELLQRELADGCLTLVLRTLG